MLSWWRRGRRRGGACKRRLLRLSGPRGPGGHRAGTAWAGSLPVPARPGYAGPRNAAHHIRPAPARGFCLRVRGLPPTRPPRAPGGPALPSSAPGRPYTALRTDLRAPARRGRTAARPHCRKSSAALVIATCYRRAAGRGEAVRPARRPAAACPGAEARDHRSGLTTAGLRLGRPAPGRVRPGPGGLFGQCQPRRQVRVTAGGRGRAGSLRRRPGGGWSRGRRLGLGRPRRQRETRRPRPRAAAPRAEFSSGPSRAQGR